MAQADQSHILSAEARTRQRDQAASELVRGLLIINGVKQQTKNLQVKAYFERWQRSVKPKPKRDKPKAKPPYR